jgi:undecaprenyl-diphosphatase
LWVRGVVAIVFGAFPWPGIKLLSLTYFSGASALADGYLDCGRGPPIAKMLCIDLLGVHVVNPLSRQQDATIQTSTMASILIIAVLLFAFGFIAQQVAEGKTSAFDHQVMLALRNSADSSPIGPAWLVEAARDLTSLGSILVVGITTLAVAGYLFLAAKPAVAWLMLIAVVGGIALNDLLKFMFARARPDFVTHATRVFTTSFPSGHATLSAITYLTVAALLARSQPSFTLSLYFMSLAAFLTVLIGVSRIYLGVHYPTDVLGGWCIGVAWAIGCWVIMAYLQSAGRIAPPSPL